MSKRKQFTPQQKVTIVRRHLVEKTPVSDLCDELGIDVHVEDQHSDPGGTLYQQLVHSGKIND